MRDLYVLVWQDSYLRYESFGIGQLRELDYIWFWLRGLRLVENIVYFCKNKSYDKGRLEFQLQLLI